MCTCQKFFPNVVFSNYPKTDRGLCGKSTKQENVENLENQMKVTRPNADNLQKAFFHSVGPKCHNQLFCLGMDPFFLKNTVRESP